jgi:hypothetical protein
VSIIDQLRQFDQLKGVDPIDPTVIQEDSGEPATFPEQPNVPANWLDEDPDEVYEPQAPPSPLIPPEIRRSPEPQGSPQKAVQVPVDEVPDLLVIARGEVCAGAYKGKDVVLSENARKAISAIVLKEILKGVNQELAGVIVKRGPRKKAAGTVGESWPKTADPITGLPAPKKRGRPKKVQA